MREWMKGVHGSAAGIQLLAGRTPWMMCPMKQALPSVNLLAWIKRTFFFGRTLKLTLGWKIRSHRSENGKKIMGEDPQSLENQWISANISIGLTLHVDRERHIVRGDFFTKAAARAFCCGSFPNRTRCRLSSGLISFCGRRKSSIATRTIELAASVHAVCGEFFQSPLFDESNLEPVIST